MNILETGYAYMLDSARGSPFVAGYTKSTLKGDAATDVLRALGTESPGCSVAYMRQVHGSSVKTVETKGIYECDGLFTRAKALALAVRTADCMPLVFYNITDGIAGVIHMGWRSAKEGIIDNIEYDLSRFYCFAGVGMRKCCYGVGKEFLAYEKMKPFLEARSGALYFDPVGFVSSALISRGLPGGNFKDCGVCSVCSELGFHSYRRTATRDRTLSFIARTM